MNKIRRHICYHKSTKNSRHTLHFLLIRTHRMHTFRSQEIVLKIMVFIPPLNVVYRALYLRIDRKSCIICPQDSNICFTFPNICFIFPNIFLHSPMGWMFAAGSSPSPPLEEAFAEIRKEGVNSEGIVTTALVENT